MSDELDIQPDLQPSLFSAEELDLLTLDQPEVRKRYTAVTLERHQAKRDAIVRALAEGWGLLRIASVYRVSHHTVSALRDTRPDLVAIEKKQLSGQLGRILRLSADKYEEALVKGIVPAGQIPVAFGIFADKKAMLDGDAGMVIEHRHTVQGTVEGFAARLRAAAAGSDLAVESASTGNQSIPPQKEAFVEVDAAVDTSARPPGSDRAGDDGLDGGTGGGGSAGGLPPCGPMDRGDGPDQQKTNL